MIDLSLVANGTLVAFSWGFAYVSWRIALAPFPHYVQTLGDVVAYRRRETERDDVQTFARMTADRACSRCVHARAHGATLRCHRVAYPIVPAFPEVDPASACSAFDPNALDPHVASIVEPLLAACDRRFEERTRRPAWLRKLLAVLLSRHAR